MTDGERVKLVRKNRGLTLEKFGERLGVAKTTISRIENGINSLTDQMCKSISREFLVNEEWLRTGQGEMNLSTSDDTAAKFVEENGLDKMEEILIREYLQLKDEERKIFRRYLKKVIRELDQTLDESEGSDFDIYNKVKSYTDELKAEAASRKLGASPITEENA